MDGGAWWPAVHGVTRSRTRLSKFTFTFHFHALEKEMATHSRVLAWGIPGTSELGGLPSMGSHRVGHDWSDLAAAAAAAGTTYKWNHIFFFCSWHFICVMLIAEYFFVSINRILFIHFFYCWTVGLFAFFWLLSIMLLRHGCVSLSPAFSSFEVYPRCGIARSYGSSVTFWGAADMLSRGWLFATPWTVARQVPLSMEFSRQEYWSGLPFPSPTFLGTLKCFP